MLFARIILLSSILISTSNFIHGQDQISERKNKQSGKEHFEWVRSIPDGDTKINKRPLQILERIIFGQKQLSISRPLDIIIAYPEEGWILSQENSEVIYFKGPELSGVKVKVNKPFTFKSLVSGCYINDLGLVFSDSAEDMVYVLNSEGNLARFCDDEILVRPTGIAFDNNSQTIWIVESGAHRISVFNKGGILQQRIGERGTGPGQFNFPTHIDIDENGFVFIVDAMNFRIQKFNNKGIFVSMFGEQGDATGKFARPKGIALDSKGNIYVADALFNNIQIFDQEGNFLYYFGKKGSGKGELMMPSGIDIDDNDYIYVSDSYNNRIQIFKPTITNLYE